MEKKIVIYVLCMNIIMALSSRDCNRIDDIDNCDDCFKCGGKWCKDPMAYRKCYKGREPDNWCSNNMEVPNYWNDFSIGTPIPSYVEKTLRVDDGVTFAIDLPSKESLQVDYIIINSTNEAALKKSFLIGHEPVCIGSECKVEIQAKVDEDFCYENSGVNEYINLKIKLGDAQEMISVKYHVPCACECSKYAEKKSESCSRRGDFVCGSCICEPGWTGDKCETEKKVRGDVPCTNAYNNKECSGNGKCIKGETCRCRKDLPGSQYFNAEDCADICFLIDLQYDNDNCLQSKTCQGIHFEHRNETSLEERDDKNNVIWVKCTQIINGCELEYATRKTNDNDWSNYDLYIMLLKTCDPENNVLVAAGEASIHVPVILGVLGVIAAAAAVVGYVLWKNRPPPLVTPDPGAYSHIDAEDCVGENPLYKPPTSNFNNPTYGKW